MQCHTLEGAAGSPLYFWDWLLQVTYSSDYFTELHNFAIQLIKSGNAYVDHQTADEIKAYR